MKKIAIIRGADLVECEMQNYYALLRGKFYLVGMTSKKPRGVHGDTITAFVALLASFYQKIPVGHVEAGLRTYDKYSPYPEEVNRQMIDVVADYYFAPTQYAADNLLNEGKDAKKIFVTGNTVIDALLWVTRQDFDFIDTELNKVDFEAFEAMADAKNPYRDGTAALSIVRAIRNMKFDSQHHAYSF